MGIQNDVSLGKARPAPNDSPPYTDVPPGYVRVPLATTGRWCLFRELTEEEHVVGRQPVGIVDELDPETRRVIDEEGARPSSLLAVGRQNQRDPMNELQLLRDLEIINARTVAELGPLPEGGLPVQHKRKTQPWRARAPIDQAPHTNASTQSENDAMKWKDLASVVALGAASTLTACATPSVTAPVHTPSEAADAEIGFYRPHTLAEYPELTPEEMGRRVLKLINSLNTADDWRVERMREVTGLPIAPMQGREQEFFFVMHESESGWDYGLNYDARPSRDGRSISYGFSKESEDSRYADISAMCGMDANAFDTALRGMGFKARQVRDEIGRLLGVDYDSADKPISLAMGLRPRSRLDATACVDRLFIYGP